MTRFVVVPQWQGSPSARAMLLQSGAEAIAGDLPKSATTVLDVPLEAGDSLGSRVLRLSAIQRIQDLIRDALASQDQPVIVIGGDCSVAVPAIGAAAEHHPNLALVWFDAHGDLHSRETSPSGAFAGMALRAAIDQDAPLGALPGQHVPAQRVLLVGARDLDADEAAFLDASDAQLLDASALGNPDAVADAVAATGATAVYVHVDLDVLDPAVINGVALPVPFGLELPQLVASIAALRARLPLVGASISGFAPSNPDAAVDDLGVILRVIGALA